LVSVLKRPGGGFGGGDGGRFGLAMESVYSQGKGPEHNFAQQREARAAKRNEEAIDDQEILRVGGLDPVSKLAVGLRKVDGLSRELLVDGCPTQ
jgi:hypothetical protein